MRQTLDAQIHHYLLRRPCPCVARPCGSRALNSSYQLLLDWLRGRSLDIDQKKYLGLSLKNLIPPNESPRELRWSEIITICHHLIIISTTRSTMQWKRFERSTHEACVIELCGECVNQPEMRHPSLTVCARCECGLTVVTGHGCRGHLVDDRPLMGRECSVAAQDGVRLHGLWHILLCHLPLRAWSWNNIRSPILRKQVGLISKQWWCWSGFWMCVPRILFVFGNVPLK